MPITAIATTLDSDEFSRFEVDKSIITVYMAIEGTSLSGEEVRVEIRRADYGRDVVKASKTITLSISSADTVSTTLDLTKLTDSEDIPLIRRGQYFIRAVSVSDEDVYGDSDDFRVALVTVENLRATYLHGIDQKAAAMPAPRRQPSVITGVTVTATSEDHPLGFFPLVLNVSTDDAGVDIKMLTWSKGETQVVSAGVNTYFLRKDTGTSNYIEVRVDYELLPDANKTEKLLIEQGPFHVNRVREIIDRAISWVEDEVLTVFLEPTRIVTDPDITTTTPATQSYPTLTNIDWDKKVDAVSYTPPTAGQWMNFKFPYQPIIKFEELKGKIMDQDIFTMDLSGVEFHSKGGFVEIIPYNQQLSTSFLGLAFVSSLRGTRPLPNFWQFTAICGFRKTPGVLLELVMKRAAIDILVLAGQAYKGGISSQSISRDGVSSSVSYTASAVYGQNSASIEEYRKWIDANLPSLRGAYRGFNALFV